MAYGIVSAKTTAQATTNIYLADVADAAATAGNQQVSLTWSDPGDVELNGTTLTHWEKTLVVRKAGSAPADRTDGTVIVTNTVKDQYKTTPFVDTTGLTNGTIYYYRFFPVSKEGVYTDGTTVSAKPAAATVPIPTITSTPTYTGQPQTPTISGFDSNIMTKSGDESGTNIGDYELTFTLVSDDYIWSNGQYTPQTVTWTIAKAAGRIALSRATVRLSTAPTFSTVTITQTGDGELSVENTDPTIASGVISGSNLLIISRVGTNVGTTTIRVKAAESNNYTAAQAEIVVTANNYSIMTVKIDESNSNPAKCCTYADDAVGMKPGSAEWDDFFGHYPCLLSGGVEGVKLNPNNFNQDINGNTVDISSGDSGDAMVAFPRRGLKMSKSGTVVTISMTDNPNDSNFEYMAHKRGSTLKDKFYLGVYMGSEVDSKLRSLKGKTIAASKTIGNFRTLARANSPASNGSGGSGYDQHGWYQLVYLQAMYVLKYKNLDSQSAVGRGYVEGNANPLVIPIATGGTETKGMDWGETTGKNHMKLFGIEDFWGNVYSWIDGLWHDADYKIWTATENFNDTGSDYTDRGASGVNAMWHGWLSKIQGDTHKGFLLGSDSGGSGTTTTYYTDFSTLDVSRVLTFGGDGYTKSSAGAFYCQVYYYASDAVDVGSRLMYL